MEATDASRLVCVVVVSYQEYSLTLVWCVRFIYSPPALLCHVAVCVWVSMFAIWMDFLRLFVYLFIPTRAKTPTVSVRVVWYWIFTRL